MIIQASTGHQLYIENLGNIIPTDGLESADSFSKFWVVKNFDANGPVMMYLGSGYKGMTSRKSESKQIVCWYKTSKKMSSGYGMTIKTAIEDAIKQAWLYT